MIYIKSYGKENDYEKISIKITSKRYKKLRNVLIKSLTFDWFNN